MTASPLPDNSIETRVAETAAKVSEVERANPDTFSVLGARTDLAGGRGVRVRYGLLPDGVYGQEVFTEAGRRSSNGKWAGEVFFISDTAPPERCEEADGGFVDGTTADEKYLYLWRALGTRHGGTGQASFAKPDARGRVLVGKAASGTFSTLGATGGSETDTNTLSTAQLPPHSHGAGTLATASAGAHTHTVTVRQSTAAGGSGGDVPSGNGTGVVNSTSVASVDSQGAHTHTMSGSTGNTGSGNSYVTSTLQPYIVLMVCVAL